MIVLKTGRELQIMREACRISAGALKLIGSAVEPGVTTGELDRLAEEYILKQGAKPNFKNYEGFPATACISINNEVIHGIPDGARKIKNGDIVSVDLGAVFEGYHGDNAATFAAGDVSAEAKRLMDVTKESLYAGLKCAVAGNRVGDISNAVQKYCEDRGYGVVRDYTGHGVGAKLHEDPPIPNYGTPGKGVRLLPGMTIAVEPMINEGTWRVKQLDNGWTVVTADGKLSAHFENTVAITKSGECVILTDPD